jgi:PAS domain S-box-containing protein
MRHFTSEFRGDTLVAPARDLCLVTMFPIRPPAEVEADDSRRYIYVNDAACELLGYSREELLTMTIDDISFPSGAHVSPMFTKFCEDGFMSGVFALRQKSGEGILVKFESKRVNGRSVATWTHYAPVKQEQ